MVTLEGSYGLGEPRLVSVGRIHLLHGYSFAVLGSGYQPLAHSRAWGACFSNMAYLRCLPLPLRLLGLQQFADLMNSTV